MKGEWGKLGIFNHGDHGGVGMQEAMASAVVFLVGENPGGSGVKKRRFIATKEHKKHTKRRTRRGVGLKSEIGEDGGVFTASMVGGVWMQEAMASAVVFLVGEKLGVPGLKKRRFMAGRSGWVVIVLEGKDFSVSRCLQRTCPP
jgi:3-hydroxymyristoyl/3-hydroxydecanoyl-(acyl carrier protein) dehydratase